MPTFCLVVSIPYETGCKPILAYWNVKIKPICPVNTISNKTNKPLVSTFEIKIMFTNIKGTSLHKKYKKKL